MVSASAPGKLLLMGDHAVVYDSPCLVTAINQRIRVTMDRSDQEGLDIESPQSNDTRFVKKAVELASKTWNIQVRGIYVKTRSMFSCFYGLGSSSAVTVATLAAIAALFEIPVEKKDLFTLARRVVLDIQRVGSGFDVAAAVYGGVVYYKKDEPIIEPVSCQHVPVVVGYTGVKADTSSLIGEVAKKKKMYPEKVRRIFQATSELVDEARVRIEEDDWKRVGKLMDFNQEYLRDLGVSSEKLETLISAAKNAGAWGAKLSGAGGGDCMIAVVNEESRKHTQAAIIDAGGEVLDMQMNEDGVQKEQ